MEINAKKVIIKTDKKSLRKRSFQKFKENAASLFFISVFFCLIAALSFGLDYLIPGASLALILFLVIPGFFGAITNAYSLKFNPNISMKDYFKYSYGYFRPNFYGSFHLIKSILKTILVELVVMSIVTSIMYAIYSNNHGASFLDAMEALLNYSSVGMDDIDYLNEILAMNDGILEEFLNINLIISSGIGDLVLLFFISFNAVEVLFRGLMRPNDVAFGKRGISLTIKRNKKEILLDYLYLNWPIMVLAVLGSVAGISISVFILGTFEYALLFSIMGLFIFVIPYFPIYLTNIEVLFEKYQSRVIEGLKITLQDMLTKFVNTSNLTEEQKQEAQRILDEVNKDPSLADDNKKDPESGS